MTTVCLQKNKHQSRTSLARGRDGVTETYTGKDTNLTNRGDLKVVQSKISR